MIENVTAPTPLVAIVTGAGGGIGAAIARRLSTAGHYVVVADIDEERAIEVAASLSGPAMGFCADVADHHAVDRMFSHVEAEIGPVSRLVNNAGFADQTPFLDITEEAWMREYAVMVSGAIHCIRRALPGMEAIPGSSVVNIASVNGMGFYSHPTYSAAKAALLSLTQSLAALFGHTGVRINAVTPGTVLTPAWGTDPESIAGRTTPLLPYVPLGKLATPDNIAAAVEFLLSEQAGQITGVSLPVDGGLTTGILPMAHLISGDR
jgi:NAD(P)-dependent dehydrogenase (short-subunit alcohol dehydrogenase family)